MTVQKPLFHKHVYKWNPVFLNISLVRSSLLEEKGTSHVPVMPEAPAEPSSSPGVLGVRAFRFSSASFGYNLSKTQRPHL